MDPWLVEGDSMRETRRRFAERKLYPDGLESSGAGDEAAAWRGKVVYCKGESEGQREEMR